MSTCHIRTAPGYIPLLFRLMRVIFQQIAQSFNHCSLYYGLDGFTYHRPQCAADCGGYHGAGFVVGEQWQQHVKRPVPTGLFIVVNGNKPGTVSFFVAVSDAHLVEWVAVRCVRADPARQTVAGCAVVWKSGRVAILFCKRPGARLGAPLAQLVS